MCGKANYDAKYTGGRTVMAGVLINEINDLIIYIFSFFISELYSSNHL